jgi:soluble lytic murein transglycosylase
MLYPSTSVLVFVALFAHVPVSAGQGQLAPTAHAALPSNEIDLWLVPAETDRTARTGGTYEPLLDGVSRFQAGEYEQALRVLSAASIQSTALGDYARYYAGMSELRLGRAPNARRTFEALLDRKPQGNLAAAAALGAADAREADGDAAGAMRIYEQLAGEKATANEDVLSRLGRTALTTGDRKKAAAAFLRVYYEFPLTPAATAAGAQLTALSDQLERTGYKADLGRAQMLFGARRYAEARSAFEALQGVASGDDKEVVDLRVAESDFYLKRWAAARDGARPYLDAASRKGEARFFHLSALRELGEHDEYVAQTRALVSEFPDSSWAEEALNNLGTHYILANDDERAAEAFRDLYAAFPTGQRAERAAWKYGWWKYKNGDYAEAIRVFENAAAGFPRSDYRPAFLYWAARAHGRSGAAQQAEARLRLVHADYGNSYYGRLAQKNLSRRDRGLTSPDYVVPARQPAAAPEPDPLPTENTIRLLLATGLYDDALGELRYAQRAWGTSTAIDATIAWAYHRKGELRRAITLMRRAYPQHLTSGGDGLPNEILQVIFPLTYWDSIRRHSAVHGLDPYVIAALIAQESTFDPQIKSPANAWGLMQVVPATGRRLAASVGIRRFSIATLTDAETNIRLGTLYFARLVKQFGGTHYALASYNAGENRVVRWKTERPGLDEDEFIDDIPFPETQNYVKRILGTAEDYRRLYGESGGRPLPVAGASSRGPAANAPATRSTVRKSPAKKPTKKPATRKPTTKTPASRKAPARTSAKKR